METRIPLTAIDPRRHAALMRLSDRARQEALAVVSDAALPRWKCRSELVLTCPKLGQRLYHKLATWIEKAGEPVYASQAYLAKLCRCSLSTVTRNLRQLKALGLIEQRRRQWQDKQGRWHEATSLYALPPAPPAPEQWAATLRGLLKAAQEAVAHRIVKNSGQTLSKTKPIQKKEGLRPLVHQKQDPKGGWQRPGPILSRMLALGTIKRQE